MVFTWGYTAWLVGMGIRNIGVAARVLIVLNAKAAAEASENGERVLLFRASNLRVGTKQVSAQTCALWSTKAIEIRIKMAKQIIANGDGAVSDLQKLKVCNSEMGCYAVVPVCGGARCEACAALYSRPLTIPASDEEDDENENEEDSMPPATPQSE